MSGVPAAVIALVDNRDKLVDRSTGRTVGPGRNLHHRKLRSRGGAHHASNLITLSGSGTTGTHGYMHANVSIATRYGFIVPSWASPQEVPIRLTDALGRRQWVYLFDDGCSEWVTPDDAQLRMTWLGLWPVGHNYNH